MENAEKLKLLAADARIENKTSSQYRILNEWTFMIFSDTHLAKYMYNLW